MEVGDPASEPGGTRKTSLSLPLPLASHHVLADFNCGNPDLDSWLHARAIPSEGLSARTYVVAEMSEATKAIVRGYYCLAAGSIERRYLPSAKLRRNMPDLVPVSVIGRLAVDRGLQGRGLGCVLLRDAIRRSVAMARIAGCRLVTVHAFREAMPFYSRFGFLSMPGEEAPTMFLPTGTIRKALPDASGDQD